MSLHMEHLFLMISIPEHPAPANLASSTLYSVAKSLNSFLSVRLLAPLRPPLLLLVEYGLLLPLFLITSVSLLAGSKLLICTKI